MNDRQDLFKNTLSHPITPKKVVDEDAPYDDEDVGPCAAIAKNRWITALTIRHAKKPWESFIFRHIDVRSTFTPTKFEVFFAGSDEKWKITVTGRNLEKIYNLIIQGRLEWIRAGERDFGAEDKGFISSAEAELVGDEK